MGVEITGKTLGVIGCGNIGSIVADRAIGLKMKVIAYDPFLSPERAVDARRREGRTATTSSRRADFITLHTPLTDKTKNILDAEAIAKTKKGVRIINCARGGLVDEAALRAALDSGQVGGRGVRRVRRGAGDGQPAVRPPERGRARRISAPPPPKRRRTSRCRSPSRCPTICLTGAISNAVNFPSITAEEAPKLKPFIALAEKLGSFAGQLTESGIAKVQITYEGARRRDEDQGADLRGARRPAAADAGRRQRGLGAGRRQGARHGGRRSRARGAERLRKPDHGHGHHRAAGAFGRPARSMPTASRGWSTSRASGSTPNSASR